MKPILINNLEFAKSHQEIHGELLASDCQRLSETLNQSDQNIANIRYKLVGSAQKMRMPNLYLQITAQLPVLCQRCLEAMQVNLTLEFNYLISDEDFSENEEEEDFDWLETSQAMDLTELIEDELLIAMPIAPVHDISCLQSSLESGEKPNPFAALKGRFK